MLSLVLAQWCLAGQRVPRAVGARRWGGTQLEARVGDSEAVLPSSTRATLETGRHSVSTYGEHVREVGGATVVGATEHAR